MLKYEDDKLYFCVDNKTYELTSQPYEPCLYINKDKKIFKIIHNAFAIDEIKAIFKKGDSLKAMNGKAYSEKEFCNIVDNFIRSDRYEADFTFIANLLN